MLCRVDSGAHAGARGADAGLAKRQYQVMSAGEIVCAETRASAVHGGGADLPVVSRYRPVFIIGYC